MSRAVLRPFWRYYGGKWRLAPRYPQPLPGLPIVEPFAGAAGYSTRYGAFRDVVLIERDHRIASIWKWLIAASVEDVLSIGDIPDGGTIDDLDAPREAQWLAGFWVQEGCAQPRKTPSGWGARVGSGWGIKARQRIAHQLPAIRTWQVIEDSYQSAPDLRGSWFVDPPYSSRGGKHYKHSFVDYKLLAKWCRSRRGLVIACDEGDADWLPFNFLCDAQNAHTSAVRGNKRTRELVWIKKPEAQP